MKLNIDFAPVAPGNYSLRLGLGSLLLALLLGIAWTMTSETEAGSPQNQILIPSEEEVQAINKAVDELNFPWLEILTLVETSVDASLRIIQFDADAREGRLILHGEARDSRAVLELPARLRDSPTVSDARVTSQRPANSPDAMSFPIRFALEVTFRSGSGEPR